MKTDEQNLMEGNPKYIEFLAMLKKEKSHSHHHHGPSTGAKGGGHSHGVGKAKKKCSGGGHDGPAENDLDMDENKMGGYLVPFGGITKKSSEK